MLRLTRKSDYAMLAAAYLAERPDEQAVSAQAIAQAFDLPVPALMNVLKGLARGGLVRSVRGVSGGYRLERSPGSLTLRELVLAAEGEHSPPEAGHPAARQLGQRLQAYLDGQTLADLIAPDDQPEGRTGLRIIPEQQHSQ